MQSLLKGVRIIARLRHLHDTWHDRSEATPRDVHGVGDIIVLHYITDPLANNVQPTERKPNCHMHPGLGTRGHMWAESDLHPHITDITGRERRRQRVAAHQRADLTHT